MNIKTNLLEEYVNIVDFTRKQNESFQNNLTFCFI